MIWGWLFLLLRLTSWFEDRDVKRKSKSAGVAYCPHCGRSFTGPNRMVDYSDHRAKHEGQMR